MKKLEALTNDQLFKILEEQSEYSLMAQEVIDNRIFNQENQKKMTTQERKLELITEMLTIEELISYLDKQVLDLMHENLYDYYVHFPDGDDGFSGRALKIIEDRLQDIYEYENDL